MEERNIMLLAIMIIVLLGTWSLLKKDASPTTRDALKSCSTDEDCIVVGTINGRDNIPEADDRCGCLCVTSINEKFRELWEQKRQEFETNRECHISCKPCVFSYDNSKAYCINNQCVIGMK